ncbi:MAG: extracellular solute-binding protein [Nitrososphaeraceae archaeon]
MKKTIHWMILTFMIISITVALGPLVQLKRDTISSHYVLASPQPKENVTITALFNQLGKADMGKALLNDAINKLRSNHPDLGINLRYIELHDLTHNATKDQMLKAITNGTHIDIISLDQIWLGEFAEKGLLADLTNYTEKWGRASEWYQSNLAGGVYKGKMYGNWFETDVRGIWYWKDLLNQANIDPNSLKTWDGYIASAKKLNSVLRPQGIEGIHLTGASHSPDIWYPYLWMLGGDIIKQKSGHPTKGTYWFPAYNSSAGVKAMQFIKDQINAGIKPIKGLTDKPFVDHKVAVYISGSWLPGWFPRNQWPSLTQRVGLVPAFPVPDGINQSSTMMGGWELAIPQKSQNKDLAWELLTIMVNPKIISPWLEQNGFLPTQKNLGSGPQSVQLSQTIPYYDKMMSMIPTGHSRSSVSEYPQIADNVREAIEDVYYGIKEPKQALDDAAAKSAKALGR